MGTIPLLTVIMPIRRPNRKYLREAIASVCMQEVELDHRIVYATQEDTLALPHIDWPENIFFMQQNGDGLGDAINTAMLESRTEFITMLPSDDLLPPHALIRLYKYIKENPNIDFFHSARQVIDDNRQIISGVLPAKDVTTTQDFFNGMVKHLLCWRRETALKIGGIDPTLHGGDDYDFPWRMYEAGAKFKAINEPLFLYRDHRSHERLTTHVPLSTQIDSLRRTFRNHNIPEHIIDSEIKKRKDGYLRQTNGWRETYPSQL
jgi:glycosyltransferase involved in cell wall biosynthesis